MAKTFQLPGLQNAHDYISLILCLIDIISRQLEQSLLAVVGNFTEYKVMAAWSPEDPEIY